MIGLSDGQAASVVGVAVLLAVGWGASLSLRSATRGPGWALHHLRATRPYLLGAGVGGLALPFVARPRWMGAGMLYVVVSVALASVLVHRALSRVEAAGGLDHVPLERRAGVLAGTARWMIAGGALLMALSAIDAVGRGWEAVIGLLVGGALTATGVAVRRRSRMMSSLGRGQGLR